MSVKRTVSKGQHAFAESKMDSNVVQVNFAEGDNNGVIANNVEIRTTKKRVTINPPPGSISYSLSHKDYIKHLIDRYHEFKKIDAGKDGLKYPIFYNNIRRRFGAKWDMVPLDRFEDLAAYIGDRIDRTKYGRIRKARGHKNYSSFSEYRKKYGFSDDSG